MIIHFLKLRYISAKEHRYMILRVIGEYAFSPVQTTFVTSIYRFLKTALYEVLQPGKHRLDFILQTDSHRAFSYVSKMKCKKIFSQPDLQKNAQNV